VVPEIGTELLGLGLNTRAGERSFNSPKPLEDSTSGSQQDESLAMEHIHCMA